MAANLFPEEVQGQNGLVNVADVLKDKKTICIYFSANWCPRCRCFTENLAKFYQKNKDKGFEVIFVSFDSTEEQFKEYFKKMPWYAIPYGDSKKDDLSHMFNVRLISTLIVVDKDGNIKSDNGRWEIKDHTKDRLPDNWLQSM